MKRLRNWSILAPNWQLHRSTVNFNSSYFPWMIQLHGLTLSTECIYSWFNLIWLFKYLWMHRRPTICIFINTSIAPYQLIISYHRVLTVYAYKIISIKTINWLYLLTLHVQLSEYETVDCLQLLTLHVQWSAYETVMSINRSPFAIAQP